MLNDNENVTNTDPPVLLLDDDPFVRDMASMLLERAGYSTVQARTAKDASTLLAETKPSVAVVDYRLPGIDGASWITEMRAANVQIPMVLLSGSVLDAKTVNVLRSLLDVRLVLRKPIDPDSFVQQLLPLLPPKEAPAVTDARGNGHASANAGANGSAGAGAPNTISARSDAEGAYYDENESAYEYSDVQNDANAGFDAGSLDDELEQMRRDYIEVAKGEIANLRSLLCAVEQDLSAESAVEAATSVAHRLRGTAGCYGFSAIGDLSGEIEELLVGLKSAGVSGDHANTIASLRSALDREAARSELMDAEAASALAAVLMAGSFDASVVAELQVDDPVNGSHGISTIFDAALSDAIKHIERKTIDLVCVDGDSMELPDVLAVSLAARTKNVPVVLKTRSCPLDAAERAYLGDSWAQAAEPDTQTLVNEIALTATMKEQWTALYEAAGVPVSGNGYSTLSRDNLVKLLTQMEPLKEVSLAMFAIDSLDEVGFLHGHAVQDEIVRAARALLHSRFRFEDIRCVWSEDKLLVALPGIPAELAKSAASLFMQEFSTMNFEGRQQHAIKPKLKFGIVNAAAGATAAQLLERVYSAVCRRLAHMRAA